MDILNLSIGNDHISQTWKLCDESKQVCSITDAMDRTVNDGIIVVCGTGNKPQTDSMCCPAVGPSSIGVSGFEPRCTGSITIDNLGVGNADEHPPPGACWIKRPDEYGDEGPFCSSLGCGPGMMCSDHRVNKPYKNNVESVSNKPDILAPAHFPTQVNGMPAMLHGTSYATPVVSAQISVMLGAFFEENVEVEPNVFRHALRKNGKPLDEGEGKIINSESTFNSIGKEINIRFERSDEDLHELI